MSELIDRLQSAEGPDRDLADDVLRAVGWEGPFEPFLRSAINVDYWMSPERNPVEAINRPDPTASVDAALTLFPEDEQFGFNMDCEAVHKGWCGYVWLGHPTNETSFCRTRLKPTRAEMLADIPRALCIAALKARADT